jgi:hypothetical protein
MGHEERLPPTRLSAGYGFRKETIAGVRHNERDAPIPAIRVDTIDRLKSGRLSDAGPIPSRPLAPGRHPKPLPKAGA